MVRFVVSIAFLFLFQLSQAQRLLTREEVVNLALNNQRNLRAANLSVQQQQQLLTGVAGFQNPQVFGEITPYEPLLFGVQQTFSLPVVYRRNRQLQNELVRLAQLQLKGSQIELKREINLNYIQFQYLTERQQLLAYQDSIYQVVKTTAQRYFEAGQINKLEELQATSQADAIRNDLNRLQNDVIGARQIFAFLTNFTDSFRVAPFEVYVFIPSIDTAVDNYQQQLLRQQVTVNERQLDVTRAAILPQIQGAVTVPAVRQFERPLGGQLGVTIPIFRRQNRSQIAAARTGIEAAKAQEQLAQQRLNAEYRQALAAYQRELQSLNYYNNTAIPQAKAIIETSRRLFAGGELNYIESLRNLQSAFDILVNHLENHRALNEAVIQLNYLSGTL
jgi:outer membrane protein TolC